MIRSTVQMISSLLIVSSLGLVGCAKSFNGSYTDLGVSGSEDNGSSGGATQSWDKVELNGYPTSGNYTKSLVIYIDKQKQALVFTLPVPMLIPIFTEIPIPDLPGATLRTSTGSNGGSNLEAVIPLKYIVRNGVFRPDQQLPNGDDLPYVPAGELPGFAIDFPQMTNYRIHLYIGVNIAAVFAELPDIPAPIGSITAIFPVKDPKGQKQIGGVGYVAKKGNFRGGVYLAAQLPAELARIIDELIRW